MNSNLINDAAKLGFKLYPRGNNYLVYYYAENMGIYTPRKLRKLLKNTSKPMTKPRQRCWVFRPGCPCCDYSKSIIKELNRKPRRQQNKYDEERDNS